MYIPTHFKNNSNQEILKFIKENSFGILVSHTAGNLQATHIPLMLTEDERKLEGHVSRGNSQWKNFASDMEVMIIFNGPHAYISSSWYDHENVPTWNYMAAHVYGTLEIIEGDRLLHSLKRLVSKYEANSANPFTMESLSPDYLKHAILGIVGFEISITKIEAAFKLSQNRDDKNHKNIITELEKRSDENSMQVAHAMKNNRCPIHQ